MYTKCRFVKKMKRKCEICGGEILMGTEISTGEYVCHKCAWEVQDQETKEKISLELPDKGVWFIGRFTYMDRKNDRIHLELRDNIKPLIDVHKNYLVIIKEID